MTDPLGDIGGGAMTNGFGSTHTLRAVPTGEFPVDAAHDACARTVRRIVARARAEGAARAKPLVVISTAPSPIVDALERFGDEITTVHSSTASDALLADPQDAVVVIAARSVCTVHRGDIVRDAYHLLRPGGRLVLVV